LIYERFIKTDITSKGNYLTSTLLKNYFMPILCRPVKSRLSARLIVRLTKITFFRCLTRKRASPIRRVSRWPRSSLTQMMNKRSHAGLFRPYGDVCRKCWGLVRQACLRLMREERCSLRQGSKRQTVGTKLVRGLFDCAESHVFAGL